MHRVVASVSFAVALLAAHGAIAQTPAPAPEPQTQLDVLSDITIRATGADPADVMSQRLGRFVASRCFVRADVFNRDPTAKFNQAYYEELTGDPGHYEKIRGPKPKVFYRNSASPSRFGGGITSDRAPGEASILAAMGPADSTASGPRGCSAPGVRASAEENTNYARALAAYDKGDHPRALTLFKLAREELGSMGLGAEASLHIARIYLEDKGVKRDVPAAVYWLERVIAGRQQYQGRSERVRFDWGDPDRFYRPESEAAMMLSRLYHLGDGVPKSATQSRAWMETAVRTFHVPAVKLAGDMYYRGYGGSKDLKKARIWYDAAGGVGHAASRFALGGMYERGESVKVDVERALQLYREAAILGDAEAASTLGRFYTTGEGVPADVTRAAGFYKDAALRGDPHAQMMIGSYFQQGAVVGKDLAMARAWYQQAARGREPEAMLRLAAMLTEGEGGERDLAAAKAWLTLAEREGSHAAATALAALEPRLNDGDRERARLLLEPTIPSEMATAPAP